MSNKLYDFNNASRQRSGFEPIPAGTLVNVQLILRMHLDTPDGWLRRSKDGLSASLDAEFEVLDGEYAKRKFWQLFMITGTTPGHAESIDIARGTLRAIVESAKGIRPDDQSEAAEKARSISDWGDLHGLCFVARVKVKAASGDFPAKNLLGMVITPDLQDVAPGRAKAGAELAAGDGQWRELDHGDRALHRDDRDEPRRQAPASRPVAAELGEMITEGRGAP